MRVAVRTRFGELLPLLLPFEGSSEEREERLNARRVVRGWHGGVNEVAGRGRSVELIGLAGGRRSPGSWERVGEAFVRLGGRRLRIGRIGGRGSVNDVVLENCDLERK